MSLVSVPGYSAVLGSMSLNLTASRTTGVSPATVLFSLDGSTAPGYDEHDFWRLGGFYWDFDNPSGTRGTFATGDPVGDTFLTGNNKRDKNIIIGVPEAAHTFIVPDGGGSVDFTVLVNVKMPDGQTGQASITITVQAQDDYYNDPANDTIAVSGTLSTGSPSTWTSGLDRNVPVNSVLQNALPTFVSGNYDGKRVMLHNDGTNYGDLDIWIGDSNVMVTYFGDEDTGTVVTAQTTISFEAPSTPTLAPDFSVRADTAGGGLIKDSANGLGSFVVGNYLTISGGSDQNGTYKIQEVAAGEIKIFRYRDKLTTEAAGDSVTLTEHNAKPQCDLLNIGHDPGGAFSYTNSDISTYGLCENITFDGIACGIVNMPMTYQHIGIHNLDMDRTLAAKGHDTVPGGNGVQNTGVISMVNRASWCWTEASLDSINVPLPRGTYISEVAEVGNPDADEIITGTTISFIAPDLVQDSGNGFSEIPHSGNANKVGHLIVSGSTSNDGTYPILTYLGSHLDYSVGAVTEFVVGETVTGSPSTATGVVTALAPASGTFAGGDSAGRLYITSITGTFTATDTLSAPSTATADCDSAVISAGGMILDTAAIVNESAGASITLTEPNRYEGGGALGAFGGPLLTWVAILGNTHRKGGEHTFRINGGYRIFAYANDYEGEFGNDDPEIGPGGKHCSALRASGYLDLGDLGDGTKTKAIIADLDWSGVYDKLPICRYYVVHDNWYYPGDVGDATSMCQISTDSVNLGLLEDCIASDCWFEDGGVLSSSQNVRMHGRWMSSRGHRYTTTPQVGGTTDISNQMDLCTEKDAGNVLSCTPFYDEPDAVPVPDAPR